MKRAGIFDRRSALNRKATQLNNVLGQSRIGKDSDGFENLDEYFASSPRKPSNTTSIGNNDSLSLNDIPLTDMEAQHKSNLMKNISSIQHNDIHNDNDNTMSHEEDFGDLAAFDDFNDPPSSDNCLEVEDIQNEEEEDDDDDDEIVIRESIPLRLSMPPPPPPLSIISHKKVNNEEKTKTVSKPKPLKRLTAILPEDHLEDDSYKRRSNRRRMEPLQYWAGERPKWGRRDSSRMPVIVDIHPPTTKILTTPSRKVQRKKKSINNAKSVDCSLASTAVPEKGPFSLLGNLKGIAGFKANVNFTGTVMDFDEHVEVDRLLALGPDNLNLNPVTNERFLIQSIFSEGGTLSSGILHFPPKAGKESRNSSNHCLICYVIEGSFQITIHQNVFIVGTGSQFIVPRGNQYNFKSLWDKDGRLFFSHCTIGEKQ